MSDDWMTPQLRAAIARLDDAVAETRQAGLDAAAAARRAMSTDVIDTARYARVERKVGELFRSGGAGDAVQQLQERVDRGDLTWQQIRDGVVDPEATRLYLENQSTMLAGIARVNREDEEEEAEEPDDHDDDDGGGSIFR